MDMNASNQRAWERAWKVANHKALKHIEPFYVPCLSVLFRWSNSIKWSPFSMKRDNFNQHKMQRMGTFCKFKICYNNIKPFLHQKQSIVRLINTKGTWMVLYFGFQNFCRLKAKNTTDTEYWCLDNTFHDQIWKSMHTLFLTPSCHPAYVISRYVLFSNIQKGKRLGGAP